MGIRTTQIGIKPWLIYLLLVVVTGSVQQIFLVFFLPAYQFSLVIQSCPTLWTPWITARQASLSITNSRSSLRLTSIESVMPSSHLILCHPLLLLPPIPPSIRVFSNESTLRMKCPKYWSFSFSIIPSKEIPGLISFRMDWLDLPAVQGTLKSLLQQHSSKASILRHSAFFTVQLSHPYMTTGKRGEFPHPVWNKVEPCNFKSMILRGSYMCFFQGEDWYPEWDPPEVSFLFATLREYLRGWLVH